MLAAHCLTFILVALMALLLTYFEFGHERALVAVFGDLSHLGGYDSEASRPRP